MSRVIITILLFVIAYSPRCDAQDSTQYTPYKYYNFQATRYFASPSGFGLKRGEAYYQNSMLIFNQFGVGITKNISISAGAVPLFVLGDFSIPVWVMPKVSIPLGKKVNLAAGVAYVRLFTDGSSGAGVAYSVLTLGSRHTNISFGGGYGFSGENFSHRPVFSVAATARIGPRGYILTENYFFSAGNEQDGFTILTMLGRRLMRRSSFDFGLMMTFQNGQTAIAIPLPMVGFSWPLGKRYPVE